MKNHRLRQRRLKIWSQDYLIHRYLWPNIERAVRKASPMGSTPLVIDVGCGHRPYRDLFGSASYFGMDYAVQDTSPDFLGDARSIPVRTASADIVFSSQVIEHVPHPDRMIRECARVLKPGGHLIVTGPFYWPLHEEPNDFYRFTKYGFARLLGDAGFSGWEITEDGGDWAQLALALNLRLNSMVTVPLRCMANLLGPAFDKIDPSRKSPCNYTVLARR
jgi:SAM-dependent methyltransferase